MGIFNFWGWFKSNFSGAIYKLNGTQNLKSIDINMDNLLIDMNGLFHTSTQKIYQYGIHKPKDKSIPSIIPNNKLTQEHVENWSHGSELSRFKIRIHVAYGSNTELVTRLLKQAALSHPKVKKSHPVIVRLEHFGENGLEMDLLFWADQSWEIQNFQSDIRLEIDRLFREYKILVPFPQREVRLFQEEKKID